MIKRRVWILTLLSVVVGLVLSFCGGDDDSDKSLDDDNSGDDDTDDIDDTIDECDRNCFLDFLNNTLNCFDVVWDCLEGGGDPEQCFSDFNVCYEGVMNDICICGDICNGCTKEYCDCIESCPENDQECLIQCDSSFDECAEWYDGKCVNSCFDEIGSCINDCMSDGVYDDCRQCTQGLEGCVNNCL